MLEFFIGSTTFLYGMGMIGMYLLVDVIKEPHETTRADKIARTIIVVSWPFFLIFSNFVRPIYKLWSN